jgi:cephalosporin hydroxylase
MTLTWFDGGSAALNGVSVRVARSDYDKQRTSDDEIVSLKGQGFFSIYEKLLEKEPPRTILEFGIFEGGSALILADMFPTAKIVGIDLRPSNPAVLRHVEKMGLSDRVFLHYGVSQSNEAKVIESITAELGGSIDLVIDDASHNYELTKASFEISLPYVREGGMYIIEDWAWAHWPGTAFDNWQGPALSNLVFELSMVTASRPDIVAELQVRSNLAVALKGPHVSRVRYQFDSLYKTAPREWKRLTL